MKKQAKAAKPRKYAAKAKYKSFAATDFDFGANTVKKKPSGRFKSGASFSE